MIGSGGNLEDLGRTHPEWKPWLTVIDAVVRETESAKWDSFVPDPATTQNNKVPMLAGAAITLESDYVGGWIQRLIRVAAQSGAPRMTTIKRMMTAHIDESALFRASLCYDTEQIVRVATGLNVENDPLQAIAALIATPFLHACNRHLSTAQAPGWTEGYCPICGGWPAFAEMRGIDRSRYSRCGRCAAEWPVHCLCCPYCGTTDHNELISLRPESATSTQMIDACKRCLGYIKTFTTLQPTPPARIILEDLATVEFDVAAFEQGYQRPHGTGYMIDVQIVEQERSSAKLFSWRR
jgi:FdhE protein